VHYHEGSYSPNKDHILFSPGRKKETNWCAAVASNKEDKKHVTISYHLFTNIMTDDFKKDYLKEIKEEGIQKEKTFDEILAIIEKMKIYKEMQTSDKEAVQGFVDNVRKALQK
ncbi:MAG: hypothetical protein V1855_03995, partial [bacterium]